MHSERTAVGIPEYDLNPLINRLPAPLTLKETRGLIARRPGISPEERLLPPHLRQQLVVLRLRKLFIPTARQVVFAQEIGTMIRTGYDGTAAQGAQRRLTAFLDQVDAGATIGQIASSFPPTAFCGSLLGPSGGGKTTVTKAALSLLPQVVLHEEPETLKQLVWLRVECPTSGSPRQLCLAFFQGVDAALGTDYHHRYGGIAADDMMLRMAHVAMLHRLGLLVVDEIQFLGESRADPRQVLNFLTTLVNIINVPVMLIGTMAALELLTGTFRTARRANGFASQVFERMGNDGQWTSFIKSVLEYQWTTDVTPYSEELADALWEASQGVIDIVMKILMLAQVRLMRASEVRPTRETITPALVGKIMKEDLKLVRGLLNALRRSDDKRIARLDDLRALDRAFADILGAHVTAGLDLEPFAGEEPKAAAATPCEGSVEASMGAALRSLGFAEDAAALMASRARAAAPGGDPVGMLMALLGGLEKERAA